jgi:hypothetical protein
MHRESVYVCTYSHPDGEHVAYVRAWDDGEAAELFAREIELDSEDESGVPIERIRVERTFRGDGTTAGTQP